MIASPVGEERIRADRHTLSAQPLSMASLLRVVPLILTAALICSGCQTFVWRVARRIRELDVLITNVI